jgi:serine/threonine-protein kinase
MSQPSDPSGRTLAEPLLTLWATTRQQFIAALSETLRGGAPPDVEAYLAAIPEPHRSALRGELEALQTQHGRAQTTEATQAEANGSSPEKLGPVGTVDYAPEAMPPDGPEPSQVTGGADAADTQVPRPRVLTHPKRVAGYEILGVLGHGAAGVVYRARQPGLNRQVALKMILSAGHASDHELARFRAEADAVARLQHPNIVQIYEVGEDDGRPFLSLEYVDGTTLDKHIHGTPQLPRTAAMLVQTLAQAVEFAHRHGIIHRDLKPGNVLIQIADWRLKIADLKTDGKSAIPDLQSAIPKITDFGLAKQLGEDSSHTRTGTILGTPGYMAPEQAQGLSRAVGPLADVYALGAILYELLTGRPPFRAPTVLETLEQVRTQEPVPPTRFQPRVPRDLETICLKCLQKDTARRYNSAGELAADLGRFVAGEPIRARPTRAAERLWRWARRNPRVAVLSATLAALVVLWAMSSSALAWRLKAQKDATEQARVQADENALAARRNEDRAVQAAADARDKHGRAIAQMIDLVEKLQKQLRSKRLPATAAPELRRIREDMLATLRDSLLALARQMEAGGVTTFGMAATCQQLGDLLRKLGRGDEARRQYQQGYDLVRRVVDDQPDNDQARANLGVMLFRLGDMALELQGDAQAARDYYARARTLQQEIADHPRSHEFTELKNMILLSHADIRLGKAYLALGDPAEARRYFSEALTFRTAWSEAQPADVAARSYQSEADLWLGVVASHREDAAATRTHFERARQTCEELARRFPRDFSFQGDLAEVYGAQSEAQLRAGQVSAANQSATQARQHAEAVLAHDPDDVSQLPLLAATYERQAAVCVRSLKPAEAKKHYLQARALREELLQTEPANLPWRAAYALALAHADQPKRAAEVAADVRKRAGQSTELLLQVARCYAVCAASDSPNRQAYQEAAVRALREATREGFKDTFLLRTDPELRKLAAAR